MRRWIPLLVLLGACRSEPGHQSPYTPPSAAERQTTVAESLNRQAAERIENDPEEAERLLREALSADLYYGPAHNNLGVVFLQAGKLYEAAHEFEWARKLMPGHPDPRVNLAMTLDQAGKVDQALESYRAALEVHPGYLPAIQGQALIAVRERRNDAQVVGWLEEIALRGEDRAWRDWARLELIAAQATTKEG